MREGIGAALQRPRWLKEMVHSKKLRYCFDETCEILVTGFLAALRFVIYEGSTGKVPKASRIRTCWRSLMESEAAVDVFFLSLYFAMSRLSFADHHHPM
jgi:hypothetical protein